MTRGWHLSDDKGGADWKEYLGQTKSKTIIRMTLKQGLTESPNYTFEGHSPKVTKSFSHFLIEKLPQ
jgi:hypothetical protein